MILGIIGFVVCVAYIFVPKRFYKLEIVAGFVFALVAVPLVFDFVSRPALSAPLTLALWVIAAFVWLKDGFANRRTVKREREDSPK